MAQYGPAEKRKGRRRHKSNGLPGSHGHRDGAPRGLGIRGEWLFIFMEFGSTGNYFQRFGELAHIFGNLGSPAKK